MSFAKSCSVDKAPAEGFGLCGDLRGKGCPAVVLTGLIYMRLHNDRPATCQFAAIFHGFGQLRLGEGTSLDVDVWFIDLVVTGLPDFGKWDFLPVVGVALNVQVPKNEFDRAGQFNQQDISRGELGALLQPEVVIVGQTPTVRLTIVALAMNRAVLLAIRREEVERGRQPPRG